MKYRIQRARKKAEPSPSLPQMSRSLLAKRSKQREEDPIDLSRLFELGQIPSLPAKRKRSWFSYFKKALSTLIGALRSGILRVARALKRGCRALLSRIRARRHARGEKRDALPMLAGVLTASLTVTLICGLIALTSFFGYYGGSYRSVVIPQLTGRAYDEAWEEDSPHILYLLDYVYNPDVTPGVVISQSPPAGVTRRIYRANERCTVTLTVSYASPSYHLTELCGMDRRDAVLELRNHGISYTILEEYSDTAPSGTVLTVSAPTGTRLTDGDTLTLTVSRGKQILYASVPSLVGLPEGDAVSRLQAAGLLPGSVSYVSSELAAGKVISQSVSPHSQLPLESTVDLTVSAGALSSAKRIPSLYGLTVAQAQQLLRSYGLVLGEIIPIGTPSAHATIVAQTPSPDTPITSSTVSVDVYIRS